MYLIGLNDKGKNWLFDNYNGVHPPAFTLEVSPEFEEDILNKIGEDGTIEVERK